MKVREMRAEDRPAVLDLLEHSFHVRELFERYMDFDAAFTYGDFLLALDGERPVACVQVFAKTIRLRGNDEVRLGGIGSVATHESYRGRGLSSELLVETIQRMRQREMALSLLFAGQAAPLYERHGWQKVPLALIRLRAGGVRPPGDPGRPFREADLPSVSALYDLYSGRISGPTVRDERYWRGQLRTAGTPEEDFRVTERDGQIVAYSRAANFGGRTRVLEYGCGHGCQAALADLLIAQTAAPTALPIPDARDPGLAAELEARGFELSLVGDFTAMWRVIDGEALAQIAGMKAGAPDFEILETLVKTGSVTYWPSDRF